LALSQAQLVQNLIVTIQIGLNWLKVSLDTYLLIKKIRLEAPFKLYSVHKH